MPATIESIDLHVRTYRSALKSNMEVTVSSLTNPHLKMEPILHPFCNDPGRLDASALSYTLYRLSPTIDRTHLVVMGQNPDVFTEAGFDNVTAWKRVTSVARRRTRFFNPHSSVTASFISSISDVDDIVNLLIAYQTEWNKFHSLITHAYPTYSKFKNALTTPEFLTILNITPEAWTNLKTALGKHWRLRLKRIYQKTQNIRLRLLAGSWIDYTKTVQKWWKNISLSTVSEFPISYQNIYFVSSNTHSLVNLVSGYPLLIKSKLLSMVKSLHPDLWLTYQQILNKEIFISEENFLYFVYKNFERSPEIQAEFQNLLKKLGILSIPNAHFLDINTQIIPVSTLAHARFMDPRLKITKVQKLQSSKNLIFNIDYPLGFAAYHILNEVLENVASIKGVYVLGKAAVLNSEIGDIEVPRAVFDEHTQNTYMFRNCFNSFFPFVNNQGSILTNQKAVSVLGTFLENDALLKKYSENNLTCVEMESGPYLSAITEATYDQQLPRNTIVDLNSAPLDVGIINYTSDNPYSLHRTLGDGFLGLNGIESVYLGSLAILQRIINLEESI
jgi:hypothetical protein